MNLAKKISKRAAKTYADPPSVIQLPGGVAVKKFAFRITAVDRDGRPTTFEIARDGDSDCVLWAAPSFVDEALPPALAKRSRDRVERLAEKTPFVTDSRDIVGTTGYRNPGGVSMGHHVTGEDVDHGGEA